MDTNSDYRQLFVDTICRLYQDLDLARGALYIAGEDLAYVDVEASIHVLDRLAFELSKRLKPTMDFATKLACLSAYLGSEKGFSGDNADYYDPGNAYLNLVLKRKKGIPITLSLVYVEVGARLGIQFEAIGLPGHLVIRSGPPGFESYVDPFHQGKILSKHECIKLIDGLYGGRVELRDESFHPYRRKQLLVRLLANLKSMYVRKGDYLKAIAAADRIDLIEPGLRDNLKERAWMFHQVGQYRNAIKDLEALLKLCERYNETESVRKEIRALWKTIATLN